jgi:hypothetical protein
MVIKTFVNVNDTEYPTIELFPMNVVDGLQCPLCGGVNIIDDCPSFMKYFCWDCTAMYESEEQFQELAKSNGMEFINIR